MNSGQSFLARAHGNPSDQSGTDDNNFFPFHSKARDPQPDRPAAVLA